MIRASIEIFQNDRRKYIGTDLRDLAIVAYPDLLSVGIETGAFDKNNRAISTNHYVKCKGNLCRLTVDAGVFMIKHPKYGLLPLPKYCNECEVIR